MEKLKPCPFCGSDAHTFMDVDDSSMSMISVYVKCNKNKCGAYKRCRVSTYGRSFEDYIKLFETVITEWNTREEQNKPVHLEEPECCKECKSMEQVGGGTWYCHMSAVLPENSQMDISTVKVDPEGKPEWCPIMKINKQLDDLPPSKREKAWTIINGLSALFGNESFMDARKE